MKGKAGQLFANRTLSGLVVVSMVLSAFAGFLFLSDSQPASGQVVGDLIVTGGTYTIEYDQWIDGNVEVRNGGELIVRDATMSIISNNNPALMHSITVGSGGTLTLDHGTVTTYLDQIDPWPFLDLVVENGGELIATENSLLKFPGHIYIQSGAFVSLTDSVVCALDESDVYQYVIGSGGAISLDSADDGPAVTIVDSTLELYDSSIEDLPEYAGDFMPASNITLSGSSTLLAVNSYIAVDFGPVLGPSGWYTHNVLVLSDVSRVHLFGTHFETYGGLNADRAPAIVATGESFVAIPTAKKPSDTTGQPIEDLQASDDGAIYHVAPGTVMAIDAFDAGPPMPIDAATLLVRYSVDTGYDGTDPITWNLQGGIPASTGIVPLASETAFVQKSFDLYGAGVTSTAQVSTLDVTFQHNGATADVQFDSLSVVISIGAEAYIYRWLDVTVGDEYGVPIPEASVSAVFTDSVAFGGQPAFYFSTDDGVEPLPPQQILDYMGKSSEDFAVTEADGSVLVPFLSDVLNGDQAPNSLFVGNYKLTGTANIGATPYASTETFSFPAYPAMTLNDQFFGTTVDLIGVSAESPDPSRWLVVPPDLTIEDMTYYHAGDIIVAAGGTLTFRNAELKLVQSGAYERTVYIDGTESNPGRLVFEDSVVISDMPINFVVQGYATLEVVSSTLSGVTIVALENSHVVLEWATTSGLITTAWDSHAVVDVTDSVLTQSPVLSGYSVGMFTNTSVPSVIVEDEAYAQIYRWILVRVYDGANKPLPGALVSTRYLVGDEPVGSALSNSYGIASLKSLGSNLTAAGSTFVGNYMVNTTYTFGGDDYYASEEVPVGVMPYTEPLGQNATYAAMYVPEVLPNLYIDQASNPVTVSPESPKKGEITLVTATVWNTGVSYAYDVLVKFYDDADNDTSVTETDMFGSAVISALRPDSNMSASAYWTADKPLAPEMHRIMVRVDPDNTVIESDESPAVGYVLVMVKNLPDLAIYSGSSDIYTQPASPVLDTPCTLSAYVRNIGDEAATDVLVRFYDGEVNDTHLIGSIIMPNVGPGGNVIASVIWTPDALGIRTIIVNVSGSFEELSLINNEGSRGISVLNLPDLVISALSFSPGSVTSGGSQVTILAQIYNQAVGDYLPAPVTNPMVRMYVNSPTGEWEQELMVEATLTATSGVVAVQFTYLVPVVTADTTMTIYLVVSQDQYPGEAGASYDNNVVSGSLTVLDSRPNLMIESADISFTQDGANITSEIFGKKVTIEAIVHNTGGQATPFKVKINLSNLGGGLIGTLVAERSYNISGNNAMLQIEYEWTVNLTMADTYLVWVVLDPLNSVPEKDETDNMASRPFTVNALLVDIEIETDREEYSSGQEVVVTLCRLDYRDTSDGIPGLGPIVFALYSSTGPWEATESSEYYTNEFGEISGVRIPVPEDIPSGNYYVRARVVGIDEVLGGTETQVYISGVSEGPAIPMFVWYIVIAAVAAVVVGFTAYTYKYGLGKLVECGECGAFIPAASKRCPKCGVEFEVGTMKCSECGAWIPAESAECPNCGVKFAGEAEEEENYLERMRDEYEEMVSKYRELAKAELGRKFNEKAFEVWWKKHPSYISFDDWLAKEEEKRKEGLVPCPVCGTPNPKEATVCHKCGTVFSAEKEEELPPRMPPAAPPTEARPAGAPPSGPPPAAPKMVIRRPVDRKVVPKKIIRTPVGTTEETAEEGKENNS